MLKIAIRNCHQKHDRERELWFLGSLGIKGFENQCDSKIFCPQGKAQLFES